MQESPLETLQACPGGHQGGHPIGILRAKKPHSVLALTFFRQKCAKNTRKHQNWHFWWPAGLGANGGCLWAAQWAKNVQWATPATTVPKVGGTASTCKRFLHQKTAKNGDFGILGHSKPPPSTVNAPSHTSKNCATGCQQLPHTLHWH